MSVKSFLLLSLSLVIGGALVGGLADRSSRLDVELARDLARGADLRSQEIGERLWRSRPLTKVLSLDAAASGFTGPLKLEVGPGDRLYVIDYGTLTLSALEPDGQKLWEVGEADGGTFSSLTDVDFGPSGQVWVADNSARRIVALSADGKIASERRVESWPYRLAAGRHSIILMDPTDTDALFTRLGLDGETTGSFGRFVERQAEAPLALDGWLEQDRQGGVVYASLYAGLLAGYDFDGVRRFLTETVDGLRFPDLYRDDDGVVRLGQDSRRSAYSLSVAGEAIYLLASETRGLQSIGAIDRYDLADGRYRSSMRLPEPCREVVVTASHLYTVGEAAIGMWRFDDLL